MKKSSKSRLQKPRPDFPLFPHNPTEPNRARWAKKVRGRLHYFGKVCDDPKGVKALELWLDQRDHLLAGRVPRSKLDVLTVEQLCNRFLDVKKGRVATGELAQRTWDDYQALLTLVADTLGRNRAAADVQPTDWERLRGVFAKKWGPWRLANGVVYTKGVWKWGWENNLLETPMRFGSGFRRPSAKVMREVRNGHGPRMFQPEQIRALLKVAAPNMKAMILLAINGGLGNTDLALLPIAALDLENGWLEYPRVKTAVQRRVPLWDETVAAIREAVANRPTPKKGNDHLLFLQKRGGSYEGTHRGTAVADQYTKAAKAAGVTGRTFYDFRRTFQTVADGARDPIATSAIMGHVAGSNDMAAIYRQRVDDDRLQAVVDHVRSWLFAENGKSC